MRLYLIPLLAAARDADAPGCKKTHQFGGAHWVNTLRKGPLASPPRDAALDAAPQLAVLITWTGKPPAREMFPWLEYWFASVQANAGFADWFVFVEKGGAGVFGELAARASNLKVVETSLQAAYDRALGFRVPVNARSIKGMKVALGAVWRAHTEKHAFW